MTMKNELFLDTSGLLSLFDEDDARHQKATAIFAQAHWLVTTNYVLAEFVPLTHVRGLHREKSLSFLRTLILLPRIEVVWRFARLLLPSQSISKLRRNARPCAVHWASNTFASLAKWRSIRATTRLPKQRAGHGDLVETQSGETYLAYLCGRPLRNRGLCPLGRETAMQRMVWGKDDWLYTENKDAFPQVEAAAPELPPHPFPLTSTREDFDSPTLPIDFQWLRSPWSDELFSLTERPGYLRLFGRETPGSLFRQALVARRQQAHCYSAITLVEFEPEHYQQQAGLICYYNGSKFHYLYLSTDETIGKHIRVMTCHPELPDMFTAPIAIASGVPVHLRVEVDEERLRFAYRIDGADWQWLPEQFDASILSDEAGPPGPPNFTGAFVGIGCQDLAGTEHPADFDFFAYRERGFRADLCVEKDV